MSNQEMQFADPDWKPSQQLDPKNNPQEQEVYNPQPVNTDYRDQNKWRTAPPSLFQDRCKVGILGNGRIEDVVEDPGSGLF